MTLSAPPSRFLPTGRVRSRLAGLGAATAALALAAAMTGTPASAAQPEGTVLAASSPTAVPGSYLVVFKDSVTASAVTSAARDTVDRYGGTVVQTWTAALRGFQLDADASAAARIAADPAVSFVQANQVVHAIGTQPNPPSWGLDRIDQRNLPLDASYTYPNTAATVHAYVIDTGIRFSHSDFGGRATSGYDAVDGGSADDCNGHGTHVSGTVGGTAYGVAKAVRLVAVRVLNCSGQGTSAQVVSGINWVTSNKIQPAVANMSLGGGIDNAIDTAVTNSIASGVTYAVAAGNNNANACNYSPARVPNAITVGATTRTDSRDTSYSNYGTCLDVFAPGTSITSDWYTSDTATNTISGTSMASPHTAGAAALILEANPAFTPQQVRDTLVNNATTGVVGSPGTGSPNRLLYVGGSTPPPPSCSGTNPNDVSIPDAGAPVTSSITISGCGRAASASSTVAVNIVHTYRGDLVINLLAPDGTSYRLKNSSGSDSADNVIATYTVNLSSEAADGTWRLQVQDVYRGDIGYINSWTLTL